ncbi:MAG: hypothetical protein CSB06_03245 [Bacteroidia bacterium]|nr:MAG: hypothetical protein CSB06_03245 [Bacteroidia bacterium]
MYLNIQKYIGTIFFLLFSIYFYGQINIGGKPPSFSFQKKSKVLIPSINMPCRSKNELLKKYRKKESKSEVWIFGDNISCNIDVKENSLVEKLDSGILYRLQIISSGAQSLNLRFSNYQVPDKAVLYLYNPQRTQILGGFTSYNTQDNARFSTGLLYGDTLILEYFEPSETDSGSLIIDRVTHGFRSVKEYRNKDFNTSGSCNKNAACFKDSGWNKEIRSVCMLVTGGNGFCTGTLINNTLQNRTPYVLTAAHCYDPKLGRIPSDMIFMFNYESETCSNPIKIPSHNDISGSVLTAKNNYGDFMLLRLNHTPPPDYNVYYAGWSLDETPPDSVLCIHHPAGDIKKISIDEQKIESDIDPEGEFPGDSIYWKVIWDQNTTTEGGSSGSALFNPQHLIIGQLHGGFASCSALKEPDWFSKFTIAWDKGSTPSERLKDHLNPNNIPVTQQTGLDPNIKYPNDCQLLSVYSDTVYTDTTYLVPVFTIKNNGTNTLSSFHLIYEINNNRYKKIWTGSLNSGEEIKWKPSESIFLSQGKYQLTSYTELPNNQEDQNTYNDTVRKNISVYESIIREDFENNPIWHLSGEFEIGKPQAQGGSSGISDPSSAFQGENILGCDLTGKGNYPGDYEPDISKEDNFAQSPVIDCRNFDKVYLSFQQYLGIEESSKDKAIIEIYSGNRWKEIEQNTTESVSSNWEKNIIDISQEASNRKILLRFSHISDSDNQYCGWNIDQLQIYGQRKQPGEFSEDSKLVHIYPNPSKDYCYIQIEDKQLPYAKISVSSIQGSVLFQKTYTSQQIEENKNGSLFYIRQLRIPKGIFIIKIETPDNCYISKLLKL